MQRIRRLRKVGLTCIAVAFLNVYLRSQPILSNTTYQQIFTQTDDFDTSYLTTLALGLDTISSLEIRYTVYNDLAYYWHSRSTTKSLELVDQALEEIADKNLKTLQGRLVITKAAVLLRMERLQEAEDLLLDVMNQLPEEDLSKLYTQLGYVYERRGLLDSAASLAMKALQLGEKLGDEHAIAVGYSDLSNLFWKRNKPKNGLEYGLNSLAYFHQTEMEDLDYGFTLYVVGNCYLAMDSIPQAKKYYEASIENGEKYGFYNNLSDVYISLTELYLSEGDLSLAFEASENAIHYASLLDNNNFMLMRSWLAKGQVEFLEQRYDAAIQSIHKSLDIATEDFGDAFFLSQAYKILAESSAAAEKYQDAYQAFEKYDALKDRVFNKEADQRISMLQTEFEVAQKETTIALQQSKLNQQQNRLLLFLIVTAFLVLISLILYRSRKINAQKTQLLTKQNEEKAFLLKEIHHRVKNNLETVSSLLALQSANINDPKMSHAMIESQNRVQSMSIIHQRLYQGQNLASIEMKDYFNNLSMHILDSFGVEDRIDLICDMNPMELDVDIAIPLGLIVNELITNSLKYAFPGSMPGTITIALHKETDDSISLAVEDNGMGQTDQLSVKGTGFGTQLIHLLTQQLNGTMNKLTQHGTGIEFRFRPYL